MDRTAVIIALVAQVLTIVTVVGGGGAKWVNGKLNGLGISLRAMIEKVTEENAALARQLAATTEAGDARDRKLLQQEFYVAQLQRDAGELKGMIASIAQNLERTRELRYEEERDLTRQLATLETNLNVARALQEGFERLAAALARESK